MATVKTLQIWFDVPTAHQCEPPAEPYYGGFVGPAMENGIIAHLIGHDRLGDRKDYVGLYSWRAPRASGVSLRRLRDAAASGSFDFVYPTYPAGYTNVWADAEAQLPGLTAAGQAVLAAAGWGHVGDLTQLPTPGIYGNWFHARSELYTAYAKTMLMPCMAAMETDPHAYQLARTPVTWTNPAIDADRVQAMFGVPHYILHPFILSRLFPTYAALLGLKGQRLEAGHDRVVLPHSAQPLPGQ